MMGCAEGCNQLRLSAEVFFDEYVPFVRSQVESLHQLFDAVVVDSNPRLRYYQHGIHLMKLILAKRDSDQIDGPNVSLDDTVDPLSLHRRTATTMDGCFVAMSDSNMDASSDKPATVPDVSAPGAASGGGEGLPTPEDTSTGSETAASPAQKPSPVDASRCCDKCGYRPRGDSRWFTGSMTKHKKLRHGTEPPKMYKCPFPGCTSQYKNRLDNLRQHQVDKNHFVEGEETSSRRPSKRRKKTEC